MHGWMPKPQNEGAGGKAVGHRGTQLACWQSCSAGCEGCVLMLTWGPAEYVA